MKNHKAASGYHITVIILLCLFVTGCGTVMQSVETDKKMGRVTAQQVEADMGLYVDAERTRYLEKVGQRLVKVNPDQTFQYQFAIVDQPVPNAFALPGGLIYVSRGLLVLTNNEDELAGVVGHEVTHVSQRHSARQLAKARVPMLLALPGAVVGGVVSEDLGSLLMLPAATIGGTYLAAHSRQDELESDQLGQRLAADAGYDPAGLAPILRRLEDFRAAHTGRKRIPGFFETHPTTPQRVGQVERHAINIPWQRQEGVTANSADYVKSLDGLLVDENPAMGVMQGRNFLHPELELFITLPEDWETQNTRQALFATAPNKKGLLVIGIADDESDPQEAATKFAKVIKQKYWVKPKESRSVEIGDLPAYLLTYTDRSARQPMHMHFLWIAYRGLIYQLVGLGPERLQPELRETALSFRPLHRKERASIRENRLRVIPARSGETLKQLSERSDNVWDVKMTAVVNGLDTNEKLQKGQLIKIAVSQPYAPNDSR